MPEEVVPPERGWRCLRAAGGIDFSATGVLASLVGPLAQAGMSVFAVSTFDTDYLMVKGRAFAAACATLRRAGHSADESDASDVPSYTKRPVCLLNSHFLLSKS